MNGSFNVQILVDKLAKLNNTQQSIETLSHWCIFHRNKARQVVDTWERQFHHAPRDQRVSFLYLANDILQNSRRKGMEFISEFWRVLPRALDDVLKNGDDFGKNAVTRLIDIWEERKVFGSHTNLKEDFLGKNTSRSKDAKAPNYKLKHPGGEILEKLASGYGHVYNSPVDEESIFGKCQIAISFVDKIDGEFGNNSYLASNIDPEVADELQAQHAILSQCIQQLKASESSRASLISHLRNALREEEIRAERIHDQLQVAQLRNEKAEYLCEKLLNYEQLDHGLIDGSSPTQGTSSSVERDGEVHKTAATGKLAASSSSDGTTTQKIEEELPEVKRAKIDVSVAAYVPLPPSQPPPPPFPQPPPPPPPPFSPNDWQQFPHSDSSLPLPTSSHPDPLQELPQTDSSPTMRGPSRPPPPASVSPLSIPPPLLPAGTHFMPAPLGPMNGIPPPMGYGMPPPPPMFSSVPNYPNFPVGGPMPPFPGAPTNPYSGSFQGSGSDAGFISPRPFPATSSHPTNRK